MSMKGSWGLAEDRYFDPYPPLRKIALDLYHAIVNLPIVSPHGHVDPRLFANEEANFGTPADLLIIPDHYVFRMLYSQGIPLDQLGIPRKDGQPVEKDHRKIWQIFANHYHLFRGTPSAMWLAYELNQVLGIKKILNRDNAGLVYDEISEKLSSPEFRPRSLFQRFNIEVLSTTDQVTDMLDAHQKIRASSWEGRIIPTFRPDQVINIDSPTWVQSVASLSQSSEINIHDYTTYVQAIEKRRSFFKELGAKATDHAMVTPRIESIGNFEADRILEQAFHGKVSASDSQRFTSHMLLEMARMSAEDGLVMQLHPGSYRNHSSPIYEEFGPDKGADIPLQTEFSVNIRPLLEKYGNDPRFNMILFTLDETTYSRELAPLAGFYPAVKLGPPWWFHDSWNGMRRYFDQVMETAGIYNTAGFNDDTRAFLSIPARHDLWRRAAANWLAGFVVRGAIAKTEAEEMAIDMAYRLPKLAYKL